MTIQIRRDTSANWTSANPTLAAGQPGYETNTGRIKIGDGTTAWTSLPYRFESAGGVSDGDKGDITISSSGTVWTIDAGAVTLSKMANLATSTILGRATAGSGVPEALSASQVRTILNVADGANNYTHPNHSGDVTSVGDGATTIANDAVTNAKLANMAVSTIKGRATAGTGDPEDLTATQVRTILNVADGANNYVHPNHSGDVTSVGDGATTIAAGAVTLAKMANLAANSIIGNNTGSPATPIALTAAQVRTLINVADGANNYVHPNHSGDVTSVADGATTIANDAVTFAKMQNIATDSLIGRDTAATGDPEAITVTGGIEFSGAGSIRTSAFTGDVTKTAGGTALTIAADAVDNTKLANMAANTIKANATAGAADPADLAVGTNTVIGRVAGNIVAAQVVTAQIAANAADNTILSDMAANTIKANATAGTADPADLAVGTNTVVGRVAGNIVAAQLATAQIADNAVTFAKLQDGVANTVLARAAATDGDVAGVALSASQLLGRGSTGDVAAITLGTNLSMSGTTLNATGGGGGVSDGDKGDITVSAAGATWTIDAGAVTLAKMADIATDSFIGRDTAGTGVPEVLSAATARTILNVADGATANATDAALRDRATHTGTQAASTITGLAAVATSGSAADLGTGTLPTGRLPAFGSGDVSFAASGGAGTIANDVVTNVKLANMATATIKGRVTAATGDPEDLTPAQARTVIEVPKITVSTTAPGSPSVGDVWIDTN